MSHVEKVIEIHKHRLFPPITSILILLLIVNAIYLNVQLFKNDKAQVIVKTVEKKTDASAACPASCISEINYATSSMQLVSTQVVDSDVVNSAVKDYYVTFGSGTSTSSTWQNVTGLIATVNPNNYPNIQQINFEVSMYIPTGNQFASIRLWDVTDGYAVWNSEMTISGGQPQYLVSNPITLAPGSKQYQVQMLTQLQSPVLLNQSRLHITLN